MMRRSTRKTTRETQTRLSFARLDVLSSPLSKKSSSNRTDSLEKGRHQHSFSSPLPQKVLPRNKHFPEACASGEGDCITTDEEAIRGPGSSRRMTKRISREIEDASSESEDIVTPLPAKRRKRNVEEEILRTPRSRSEQDKLDLEEDLEDLRDSVVTQTRTRGKAADSAKVKRREQLEALKRRRAGEKPTRELSPNPEPELTPQELGSDDTDQSSEEMWYGPAGQKDDSDIESEISEDLDEYEEDFVLKDDGGELGVPADIPFEFTRHRYKKLNEHFKDVVEWMVHNKLNPAFPRNDAVYQVAFAKVKDEVTGLAGSQLISSAWNIDFKRALEARPQIEVTLYPVTDGHPCDACNKTNHPASFDVRFDGKPYLLETLESISDDDSDEDEEEEAVSTESGDLDRDGNPIPDSETHFFLGRHCKAKATMAHTLVHWRYHLNEWVIDYLQHQGVFSDAMVLEREHWSQKRRSKYANEVVDSMKEVGEIDRLWKDFNINLKAAREMKEPRW